MDKPIRVLQIIGIVCGGGVESVVMNYYRNIDKSKVQFDFVIDGYEKSLLDDEIASLGGKIYKVEPYKTNIFKYMSQIYKIVKEEKYNVVHSHMNTLAVFGLFSAWLAGAKVRIAHNHATTDKSEGVRHWIKIILRPFNKLFANRYCACSKVAGRWMFGSLKDVVLIKNAFDLSEWDYSPSARNKWRNDLNIEDKFVLGHIGRFEQAKNHMFLLEVFKEIQNIKENSILILVGDGNLKQEILSKATELKISNSITFMGLRKDANEIIQAMDVLLIPSFFEGLSMVAMEGQETGIQIIASNRIPAETAVTDSIVFLPLECGAKHWAEKVMSFQKAEKRKSNKEKLQKAGYDIIQEAKILENWYLNNCENYLFEKGDKDL